MRFDFILILGIMVNILLALIFPAQIFGENPPFETATTQKDLSNSGVFSEDIRNQIDDSNAYNLDSEKIANGTALGQDGAEFSNPFSDTGGTGFLDWIFIGLGYISNLLLFIVPFISILFLLPSPLNFILGTLFASLYFFSLAKFLMGR